MDRPDGNSGLPDSSSVLSLLLHLSRVYQIKELFRLVASLEIFSSEDVASGARAILPGLHRRMQVCSAPGDVPENSAEVASLILGHLGSIEPDVQQGGAQPAFDALRRLLYATAPPLLTMMQLAAYIEPVKAEAMRRICVHMLEEALSPTNCLQLLQFAEQHGFPLLAFSARALAVHSFSQVAEADRKGLICLTQERLNSLLCARELAVKSEADKFGAITMWVQAEPAARTSAFGQLFDAIKLQKMNQRELVELDMHPLVVEDLHVTGRVARAFIMLMFGPLSQQTWPGAKDDITPVPFPPPSAARQCFQSASSSLYGHLCDTASPAIPPTPGSDCSQVTGMQIDVGIGPSGDAPLHMHELPHCLRVAAPLPVEMDISPGQAHRNAAPRPQLPTCKRQLFKG